MAEETTAVKTKKTVKIFRGIGILLLALILIIFGFDFIPIRIGDISESDMKYKHGEDWCSYVSDEKNISEIVIPGTHDSATQYISLPYFSKTQGSSMQQQLKSGYRFFDMRLKLGNHGDGKGLFFVHGPTNARQAPNPWSGKIEFGAVIKDFCEFLDANENEFVLISIKKENSKDSDEQFQKVLKTYIESTKDYWCLDNNLPKVGDVRKKMVLLRRFKNTEGTEKDKEWGIPFLWEDQKGSEGTKSMISSEKFKLPFNLYVQDHFEYETEEKWKSFEEGLNSINKDETKDSLHVNYLSTKGSKTLGHPIKYAYALNDKFLNHKGDIKKGIQVFDFANGAIVEKVVSYNNLTFGE